MNMFCKLIAAPVRSNIVQPTRNFITELFTSEQLDNYADVLIWGMRTLRQEMGGKFRKYDIIKLVFDMDAMPLAERIYARLVEQRFHVHVVIVESCLMERDLYALADTRQLKYISAGKKAFERSVSGYIQVWAPVSSTHLEGVDPKRIAIEARAYRPIKDIGDRKTLQGNYGWTLTVLPTKELAALSRMTLSECSQQIIKACYLDHPDPVGKWQEIHQQTKALGRWLGALPIDSFRIESASMDLEIKLGEKRRFMNGCGANIPSFEIYTSPDWRGTRGTYFADLPTLHDGNQVSGIHLRFEKGKVVEAHADSGEDFLHATLRTDSGARAIGEFSLTDKRFSNIDAFIAETLFNENYGGAFGNCHIALGNKYEDAFAGKPSQLTKERSRELGFNSSAIHWDLVNTENKVVTVRLKNGKQQIIYENGMFTI